MGHANFCPVCGEIVGGWDYTELTPCKCDRVGLMTNSGAAYEASLEQRIEELEAQVGRLQNAIEVTVSTYGWDLGDHRRLATDPDNREWSGLEPGDLDPL